MDAGHQVHVAARGVIAIGRGDRDVLARAQILPGIVRAYPAIAGGLLYARNDNTLVCLDLRK